MAESSAVSVLESSSGESQASKASNSDHATKRLDDFSDPVFKKLSVLNGEINRMSREQLQHRLSEANLDTRGVKDVLRRRLKNHYRSKKLKKAHIASLSTKYDYIMVMDFEATCEQDNTNYQHEIIEFPVVLIDVAECKAVGEFHSFCTPVLHPRLSEFCTELTGITQANVESGEVFPTVLQKMEEWMKSFNLGRGNKFAIATDGPWDMSRFLYQQCKLNGIPIPKWGRRWINVRKCFTNFYGVKRANITSMLENLGLDFEGRLHSGLDDTRNIARIVISLLQDKCVLKFNEYFEEVQCKDRKGITTQVHPILEEDDKKPKSVRKSKNNEEDLAQQMQNLDVSENGQGKSSSDDLQVDDLLYYYKLQKS